MKKKFSYKDILYKSKRLTALALIVVFGTGLMVTAGMHDEIPVHDGDVLVDSRAATEQKLPQEGTFAEMRASLDLDRSKLLANLDSTINNSENENEKKNASAEKSRIMDTMEKELSVESMIKSKGLPESFVIMTDSSVTVTVDKQELDSNTVAKICDIVMRETGKTADKIVVQSKYCSKRQSLAKRTYIKNRALTTFPLHPAELFGIMK